MNAPTPFVAIENVVFDSQVVRAREGTVDVNPMVIAAVIQRVCAAIFAGRIPANVVNLVLLDGHIVVADKDPITTDRRGGAVATDIVDIHTGDGDELSSTG